MECKQCKLHTDSFWVVVLALCCPNLKKGSGEALGLLETGAFFFQSSSSQQPTATTEAAAADSPGGGHREEKRNKKHSKGKAKDRISFDWYIITFILCVIFCLFIFLMVFFFRKLKTLENFVIF
jgi:hypothetical protein